MKVPCNISNKTAPAKVRKMIQFFGNTFVLLSFSSLIAYWLKHMPYKCSVIGLNPDVDLWIPTFISCHLSTASTIKAKKCPNQAV